jgi:hypothetical protein
MSTAFPDDRLPPQRRAADLPRAIAAIVLALGMFATAGAAPAKDAAKPAASPTDSATDADAKPADLAADATYRLPGLLRRDSTLDALRQRFGAQHVTVAEIDGAEGETSRGIVLFADDPKRRAEIFPQDDATMRGIASIRVSGKTSRWHLDNGLRLGMTLAELVAANGKPVTFNGLDWDYGGGILDWNNGRLATGKNDAVFRSVSLSHDEETEADSFPLGDGEFRSDDPRYPKQGKALFVGQVMISFVDADGT